MNTDGGIEGGSVFNVYVNIFVCFLCCFVLFVVVPLCLVYMFLCLSLSPLSLTCFIHFKFFNEQEARKMMEGRNTLVQDEEEEEVVTARVYNNKKPERVERIKKRKRLTQTQRTR